MSEALLKALVAAKMQLGTSPVGQPTQQGLSRTPSMEPSPEIQLQEVPMEEAPVQQMGEFQPEDSNQPMTQIDNVEARRAALERLKMVGNQKLNFRGGLLDQNGVYDND